VTSRSLTIAVKVRHASRDGAFTLDVELDVPPGITCVLGRSGAGKSTLLGAIAGLVRPDSGRIALGPEAWFDAAARVDVPTRDRHVAYVFQSLALFPHMTAISNVAYGMSRALPRAEREARARALLAKLEVGHLAVRRPRTFSGGEAQRVALARALAMAPRVLLLDEPFSALDRDLRGQLARLVRALVDELGVPLLFVTHNIGEARALADRVVRIDAGVIVERGTPAEVLPRTSAVHDMDDTPMPELKAGSSPRSSVDR
jgi:molybdate transport system ATP-binding protein